MRAAAFVLALTLSAAAHAQEPAPADPLSLNPLAALDKAALDGFRDMPLFTPSRTRPEPEAEPVVVAPRVAPPVERRPSPPPSLKLSGVVEGPEGAVAVVRNGSEVERLRLGDQVDGWLVTAIDGASLKLTLDDREQDYRMFARAGEIAGEDDEDAPKPDAAAKEEPEDQDE